MTKLFRYLYSLTVLLACAAFTSCQQQAASTSMAKDSSLSKQPDGTLTYTDTVKSQSAPSQAIPADQLIIPGKSVGLTHIGEDMNAVLQRLGKPDAGDHAMGKSMSFWYAKHDTAGYKTAIYATRQMGTDNEQPGKVKQILVTSPYFKTADAIHTGVTYRQVAARYSLKKVAEFGKATRRLTVYDTGKGIAFEFDIHQVCRGIIVHTSANPGGVTYLAFHPELE